MNNPATPRTLGEPGSAGPTDFGRCAPRRDLYEVEMESLQDLIDSVQEPCDALREMDRLEAICASVIDGTPLDFCPSCGGPADNGHDREYPPNPYLCKACHAFPNYS